jgi:Phage integrase family
MRIGEAIALDRSDFAPDSGTLTVRNAKSGKSRELPLHPSTAAALKRYLARRDGPTPVGPTEALFVSTVGTRLLMSDVQTCFRTLRARAGILPRTTACRPRLHDLRHSFAVRTLLDAYRTDGAPGPKIAALSSYLGHVNPGKTYWYPHAAPLPSVARDLAGVSYRDTIRLLLTYASGRLGIEPSRLDLDQLGRAADRRVPRSPRDRLPTEFSAGAGVGAEGRFGPFFLHRSKDDVVVGEIGGASSTRTGRSRSATPSSSRSGTVDTRPPKSGRVLEKAGFAMVREVEDADEAGNVVLVTD